MLSFILYFLKSTHLLHYQGILEAVYEPVRNFKWDYLTFYWTQVSFVHTHHHYFIAQAPIRPVACRRIMHLLTAALKHTCIYKNQTDTQVEFNYTAPLNFTRLICQKCFTSVKSRIIPDRIKLIDYLRPKSQLTAEEMTWLQSAIN